MVPRFWVKFDKAGILLIEESGETQAGTVTALAKSPGEFLAEPFIWASSYWQSRINETDKLVKLGLKWVLQCMC